MKYSDMMQYLDTMAKGCYTLEIDHESNQARVFLPKGAKHGSITSSFRSVNT